MIDDFEYGIDIRDGIVWSWMRPKFTHWSSMTGQELMKHIGFDIGPMRSQDLVNFAGGDYDIIYYIASLENEEALKWLLGPLAVELKKSNILLKDLMSARHLNHFVQYLNGGKFDKAFAKDIFNDYLSNRDLDEIIKNPKYKAADTSEVDLVVEKVFADNPNEVEKARKEPKMINWLVGQAMKQLKGKASGPALHEKFNNLIKGD